MGLDIKCVFSTGPTRFRPILSFLKLLVSSRRTQRCAAIVCTPKKKFLYSDGIRRRGGVVSRSRKILKKKNCVIYPRDQLWEKAEE